MGKKTVKNKNQSKIKGYLIKAIMDLFNILHKNDPNEFPKVPVIKNYSNKSNLIYEINFLLRFFKQRKKTKDPHIIFAGLTWNFNAKKFYRNYSPVLGHIKVSKILLSLRVKKETLEKYNRKYSDIIKMSKKTVTDKNQSNNKGDPLHPIMEFFNILHKYDPSIFPETKPIEDHPNFYSVEEMRSYIITERGENLISKPVGNKSKLEYEIDFLLKFFKQHKNTKDPHFIFAGLTWNFNAKEFYRKYSPTVGHKKVNKILLSLRIKQETIDKYGREFHHRAKMSKRERFIYELLNFAEKKVDKSILL